MLKNKLILSLRKNGLWRTIQKIIFHTIRNIKMTISMSISPFIIYFFPRYINFLELSMPLSQKLPNDANRLIRKSNLLEDFDFCKISAIHQFEEVNLIMRGESLNLNIVDKTLPTFFLNPAEGQSLKGFDDKWLATGDDNVLRTYLGQFDNDGWKGYKVKEMDEKIFFVYSNLFMLEIDPNRKNWSSISEDVDNLENTLASRVTHKFTNDFTSVVVFHKSGIPHIRLGSGIAVLIALMNCSTKVNVHGWDQYMKTKVPKTFYRQIKLLWPMRSFTFFATCIINWIYAFRIINEQSDVVKIEGRINEIKNINWIPDKAFHALYKE